MSRWFRFYDDAINDPKVQRLTGETFKAWINVLCIASKHQGVLPSVADIAFALRLTDEAASDMLNQFYRLQLLDEVEIKDAPMGYTPHNWNGRQYKSDVTDPTAPERQKRYRKKKRNGRNATVTATPTRTDTEADTEQNRDKNSRVAALDDWPADFGDQFWQAYPRKTEKLAAMRKLVSIRKSAIVTFVDLMAGVQRYAAAGTDPKFTKHPTTWLNAGCWADESQPGGTNGNGNHTSPRGSRSDDFFAGMRSVAADIAGDGAAPGPAAEEIPRGRVEIEG